VFRSPEFITEPLHHLRFVPGTLAEALWRPFAMLDPVRMVHEELSAPDLRYAFLVVLVGVLLWRWLWGRRARPGATAARSKLSSSGRVLAGLGGGLAADWVLWLASSGNSRYFLPMASVAAVVMVALLFRLFATRPKIRNYVLAGIFGVQAIQLWMGTELRWHPVPWDGPWFKVAVPDKLATEPDLYLTMGVQSNSFIAPFLAPGSGLVNFAGGYALGPEGASGARIGALIRQFSPRLRVLLPGERLYLEAERRSPTGAQVDDQLARFGLRVDPSDCLTITVHDLPPPLEVMVETSAPRTAQSGDTTYLVSCSILPGDTNRSAQLARQRAADLVLDRLEDACPDLFQPRRLLSEPFSDGSRRMYINTDLVAWVSRGQVKFNNPMLSDGIVYLGRESDWAKAPLQLACEHRNGHYFAHVLAPVSDTP
jgi:hypothetical protein